MAAVILGWDPSRWNGWNYDAVIELIAQTGEYRERWSVGGHHVQPGTEAWLLLQGQYEHSRGLIGHGSIMSEPFAVPHQSGSSRTLNYVDVSFDALLPLGSQILVDVLKRAMPLIQWDTLKQSGQPLPEAAEPEVRRLWREHAVSLFPDPLALVPGGHPEGTVTRVTVNRYEHSSRARRACLAFHGTTCAACGFSFEERYGEVAKNFVQVHHIVPVSQLGPDYVLDPVADLIPLCANCHAVAHLGVSSPRSVHELRELISEAGHLSGQVVTPEALQAQESAQKILDQK
ncbi:MULTISPECIES: HNH endonuclease [Arthrobacter]|uniref:Restriction endonuclease n=1 Tax=Arthrobacter terricola TaxID=2547396 RepID=A0A4R5KBC0_9MICC|nr:MULTISPECIES: HNH endonuclease [Arthrobacter]MBT8163160.1 HNH endonuclease [Arthrobacter sp. GN70]TDF91270.1 restriction endonuclease [Arthrobacter terricola]